MEDKKSSATWYCVRTGIKQERLAAASLREHKNVEVICPILRYKKATRRGKIWWEEAMFPGYVLVNFSIDQQRRYIEATKAVRGLVKFGASVPEIPAWFIHDLRHELHITEENETITLTPTVQAGDEVEVIQGPLKGAKAIVSEVQPAIERVKILLEFLGQEQRIDVDLFSLLIPRRVNI